MAMEACTGCRVCADVCPAVLASRDGTLSGVYRLNTLRADAKSNRGILRSIFKKGRMDQEAWAKFSETVYRCTLCGNCQEVCPSGISLKDLWLDLRQDLVDHHTYPKKIDMIRENLSEARNVFAEDQEERAEWVEDMDDEPEDGLIRDRAEVVYFTGCVAAYFPLAQKIPIAVAEILQAAESEFTLLGEEEWCCGFPLVGAGLLDETTALIEHNVEAIRAKGAKEVVFACPSCFMMWKEHYPPEFKLWHATQYLEHLIVSGRVPMKKLKMKVTYHDPCDLGRGARVFDPPRRVIRSIPGIEFVELAQNREQCQCCGGGGNLEMIDQNLSGEIARRKIDQVLATGADAVISSCQQCVRTMMTYVRRNKINLKVMDISQLVRLALDD